MGLTSMPPTSRLFINVILAISLKCLSAVAQVQDGVKPFRDRVNDSPMLLDKDKPMPMSSHFLFSSTACSDDIRRLCSPSNMLTDFNVLDCFQNSKRISGISSDDWSPECSHLLWTYQKNITQTNHFINAAQKVCKEDLLRNKICGFSGQENAFVLSCMIENKHNFTSSGCKRFLTRMETIILSDYRLIYKFAELCGPDISKFKCGRASSNDEKSMMHGKIIECLSESVNLLEDECQREVLKISEWQADDFRLDRALYFACRDDQEHFCTKVTVGEGKIYDCLMSHKLDRDMSKQCQDQLVRRQKLISMDYKVSRSIATSCKEAIKTYKCKKDTSSSRGIRLAQILLCLENVLKKGEPVAGECQRQMLSYRRALMEDYRLSPNLIDACEDEIQSSCSGQSIGGKTIHCLMDLIKHEKDTNKDISVSLNCKTEMRKFLREVDLSEDWSIDPVLKEACQSVVDAACSNIRSGSGRVISCLMDKIDSDHMTTSCEEALLRIQYFVARDYTLDPNLYRNCESDVTKHCNFNTGLSPGASNSEVAPVVFACLYKLVYHPQDSIVLKPRCVDEVKKVMHQYSVSVDLHPEIVDPCLSDLSKYCSRNLNRGEEIDCLQENYENLKSNCQQVVRQFTEMEAENTELNVVLLRACSNVLKQLCQEAVKGGQDHGALLSCLVQHKNDFMVREEYKCRVAIDHFQLVSLKDFHFDYKFKTACRGEVLAHCKDVNTKYDVVSCLSSIVLNNTLGDLKHQISKECRRELRQQLLQRSESVLMDPRLGNACRQDIQVLCQDISPGNSQILECLRSKQQLLSDRCSTVLFRRQVQLMTDQGADYNLVMSCSHMFSFYCNARYSSDYIHCLQGHIQEDDFDPACRKVIVQRLIEQGQDFRLNPSLQKACHKDISLHCTHILGSRTKDKAFQGKVIQCLKNSFRKKVPLNPSCEQEVHSVIKNNALDSRQDPILMNACDSEIKQMCLENDNNFEDNGQVLECLKHKLLNNEITNINCVHEVSNRVETSFVDIQTDPLLYHACSLDIKRFCYGVPPGEGRHLACLVEALHAPSPALLTPPCRDKLQERINMYENVGKNSKLEDFQDIYYRVYRSPSRNYFIIVCFTVIGFIFFGGLVCGRITKRIRREMKMK